MSRHRTAGLALLLPFVLAACGTWVHPTKPSGEFAYDDATCRQQAIEKVTASHQKHDAPKWMTRGVGTKSYTVDGNDTLREQWHRSCLVRLGWARDSTAQRSSVASTDLLGSGPRLIGR